MRQCLTACALLAGTALLFLPLVLHPGQVLYSDHSDLLAEHVPAKRFLVHAWQETGELPLWCPYSFGGMPFVHDVQVGIFYPPHWPLLLLSEQHVGAALSWLIVLHVILAGWLAYAYARSRGLGQTGALVAGLGYEFAGKWLLHLLAAGHSILVGLAWLPLALLLLERAIRKGSVVWATLAGGAFALLALGTGPQWTFYAGLFAGLWTLGLGGDAAKGAFTPDQQLSRPLPWIAEAAVFGSPAKWPSWATEDFRSDPPWNKKLLGLALVRWALLGAWAALVALGLSAVQLLPTMEAATQATRSAGVSTDNELSTAWQPVGRLLGPGPGEPSWEDRGGLGVLWLAAAALAPLLRRGRVRYETAICLLLFAFALGSVPLVQSLPGFRLFRFPGRVLIVAGFPVAFLAGVATDALCAAPNPTGPAERQRLAWFGGAALLGLLTGLGALANGSADSNLYWCGLPLMVLFALGLVRRLLTTPKRQVAWIALLFVDSWLLTGPLVAVRPETELYDPPECVRWLTERGDPQSRVMDQCVTGEAGLSPLGAGAPLALTERLQALSGCNPLDVLRFKEYLQLLGGKDAPLRPLTSTFTYPVMGDYPATEKRLLDLLGVRYLLLPTDTRFRMEATEERTVDPRPGAYCLTNGGMRELPSFTLYENRAAFPRAFVVPEARPLPEREKVLATLRATDFRRTVLLEEWRDEDAAPSSGPPFRPVAISSYQPNRVVLDAGGGPAGWLVLADVWYPGWACTVDGTPAELRRGNYLFRAVRLPEGARKVVFTFAPHAYRRGRALSLVFLAGSAVLCLFALTVARYRKSMRLG